jgi:hypothetical protein
MGLETATFIAGLTPTWPIASEPKSQGDDHLRLIKSVLQATFPAASKAMYFPKAEVSLVNMTLDATDQNNFVLLDTTAGNINITLPTLTAADNGWACEIVKTSADGNAVVVSPTAGTISSQVGATPLIRVGALFSPTRFVWTGTLWICLKPGAMVGSTVNWDGPNLPPGWYVLNGAVLAGASFPELALAMGLAVGASITLRDKRGRVEAGVDGGVGRLTGAGYGFAGSPTLGGTSGTFEYHYLTTAELPSHVHANSVSDGGHQHAWGPSGFASSAGGVGVGGGTSQYGIISTNTGTGFAAISISNAAAGSGSPHTVVQPTIITQKLIRAC